jgi:hypothetical protein
MANAFDDIPGGLVDAATVQTPPSPPRTVVTASRPMKNAFDDLPPGLIAAPASSASAPNAFDDISPPARSIAPQPPATWADRGQALEGGVLRGGAYLAGLIPDTISNAIDLGKAAVGTGYHLATGNPIPSALEVNNSPSPVGAWLSSLLDKSPITTTQPTRPDDAASRYLAAAGSVVPGAFAGGGGAVGPTVRALAGAMPSVLAGQSVAEAHPFQSDTANNAASALAQALTGYAAPAAAKGAIRGVSPATMQENIQTFRDAGAEPSLAQAAGTRRMQFLESGLSKIPGSAGVIQQAAEDQAQALRGGVDQTVSNIAPGGVSPERAGRAINQGILGEGGFKDQFNAAAQSLFDKVNDHIPPGSPVGVNNTLATLDAVAKPNPLAPSTTAALINPKLAQIRTSLLSDVGEDGSLPYSAVSNLRSQVGEMLTGSDLTTDIPRMQVKRLYGALSSDLKGAAQDAGPDAAQAFSRAQTYYSAGMGRMDTLADVLDRNGGPEQVFTGAMAGTRDGATRLRAVMQSLAPEQQQVVAATVFKRMGQATAGNQSAAGDVFSPESFLTRYNQMSPEAKSALFDRVPGLQEQAENMADVAANLRNSSQVFKNASGTAAAEQQTHTMRDLLVGSLLGGEGGHALLGPHGVALAAAPLAANVMARGMVSPTAVNWAAAPVLGSTSQIASGLSIPANDAQRRLAQALQGGQ